FGIVLIDSSYAIRLRFILQIVCLRRGAAIMKARFERVLVNFAIVAATSMVSMALLNGQINPATSTGSQVAPSGQVQKTDQPSPPQALNGTWKLNADKSDDADEKLRGRPPQQ